MKIAIFGASVSAQTRNHTTKEATGYAEVLRREHMAALGATEIRQITYGGNRASDAGLLLLEEVISYSPDICLFEPLIEDMTRGARITESEARYIYRRLLTAGICPVTLMLPIPAQGKPNGLPEFAKYSKICKAFDLPVIRIDLSGVTGIAEKFNGIHTRLAGARIYADKIVRGLRALGDMKTLRDGLKPPSASGEPIWMRKAPMSGARSDSLTSLRLRLVLEKPTDTRIRIVQQQSVGPFSPMLDVAIRGKSATDGTDWVDFPAGQASVWDKSCHYTRDSFVVMNDFQSGDYAVIELDFRCSETDPDYATCRREVASWPLPSERVMKPLGPLTVISHARLQSVEII